LTFQGHVTSSVTWPFDSQVAISYRHSIVTKSLSIAWLSMVLRLRQRNIGYKADGFYRSDDPTNSVKALKDGG